MWMYALVVYSNLVAMLLAGDYAPGFVVYVGFCAGECH